MNRDFRKDTEGSMKKLVEIVQEIWVGICRKTVQNRAESMCRIVQIICAESCVAVMCLQNGDQKNAEFCKKFVQNRAQLLCRILQRISADVGPKDEPGFS